MCAGTRIHLPPKAFDALLVLVQSGGRLVSKDELMEKVWPDTFVEESSLTVGIFALRKALGDGRNNHSYIETVPRRGYRFVAIVIEASNGGVDSVAAKRARLSSNSDERFEAGALKQPVVQPIADFRRVGQIPAQLNRRVLQPGQQILAE